MAFNTNFIQARDNAQFLSNYLSCMPFTLNSEQNNAFALTSGTAQSITVPSFPCKIVYALFTYTEGADVWVSPVGTPTLTVPSTAGATLAQLKPLFREVVPGQVLQFIYSNASSDEAVVSVGINYFLGIQNFSYNAA